MERSKQSPEKLKEMSKKSSDKRNEHEASLEPKSLAKKKKPELKIDKENRERKWLLKRMQEYFPNDKLPTDELEVYFNNKVGTVTWMPPAITEVYKGYTRSQLNGTGSINGEKDPPL